MAILTTALAILAGLFLLFLFLGVAVFKLAGCTAYACLGNIICGGAIYWFLDAFHIVAMRWTLLDGIIVALLGIPGTLLIALYRLLF